MPHDVWEPSPRDILIDRVRRGEIEPDEAEAEALRKGFGPLATKPDPIEFDPRLMPWWTLPMALAWIAWRTEQLVKKHCAEYRENCLQWFPGSWNVPDDNGTKFKQIDGYELKALRQSTTARLALSELYLSSIDGLPPSTQMTITKAEKQLLAALAGGKLVAVAKDDSGGIVDIPQREWPYLQLYEEHEQDVLKRRPLDRQAAFTDVKLKQEDLRRLWQEFLVEPYMIEPMMRQGTAGYVPLCSVLHWIMTTGGSETRNLDDIDAWTGSVDRLLPLISSDEIQILGRPNSGGPTQPIENHVFADILVAQPLRDSFSMIGGDNPWISCTPYVDEQHWKADFNDQLFLSRSGPAAWTHLQVKKSDVLREIQFIETETDRKIVYETGAPGRPTSMQLVRREFDARHEKGLTARSITQEAAALSEWLSKTHPDAPPVKPKTIKNQLAEAYRNRVSARK